MESNKQLGNKEFIIKDTSNELLKLVFNNNSVMFVQTLTQIKEERQISKKIINDVAKDNIASIKYEETNTKEKITRTGFLCIAIFLLIAGVILIVGSVAINEMYGAMDIDSLSMVVPAALSIIVGIIILIFAALKPKYVETSKTTLSISDKNDKPLLAINTELTDQELLSIINACRE